MNETDIKRIADELNKQKVHQETLRRALDLQPVPGTDVTEEQLRRARTARSWFTVLSVVVSFLVLSAGNVLASALTTQVGYYISLFSIGQGILHLRDMYGSAEYHTETEIVRGNVAVALRFLGDVVLLVACLAIAAISVTVTFSGNSTDYNGGDGSGALEAPVDSAAHTLSSFSHRHQRGVREPWQTHRQVEYSRYRDARPTMVRNAPLMVQSRRKGAASQSVVWQGKDIQRANELSQNRQRHARVHRA